MDSKTSTKIRDKFSFLEIEERNKGGKRERATDDKLTIFR
jgi:hypothetical protein